MKSEFAGETPDLDSQIHEALAERAGKSLRLRVQPQVLSTVNGRAGQYAAWKNNSWSLDFETAEEVFALRDALRAFFDAANRVPVVELTAALRTLGHDG